MDKYNLTTYDEDDDVYSGFNEFHPTLNTSSLIQDSLSRDVKNQQAIIQMQVTLINCFTSLCCTGVVHLFLAILHTAPVHVDTGLTANESDCNLPSFCILFS